MVGPLADFQTAITAHMPAWLADIPNYTDIAPVIQVSEIVVGDGDLP
jgi:hypothetical protein